MRGTFTHYNTDFTNDLFHMADDLGFDELSMEPVSYTHLDVYKRQPVHRPWPHSPPAAGRLPHCAVRGQPAVLFAG